LAGGTGPRASYISVVFTINRANDECELLRHVMLNLGNIVEIEMELKYYET
jgi:hypothetical protein